MLWANSYFQEAEAATFAEPVIIFTLDGSHEIPQSAIADPGQLNLVRGANFGDIGTSDHTLTLIDTEGTYLPNHSNFLWRDTNWFRKSMKVELGYRRHGSETIDRVLLFEGFITEWKVMRQEPSSPILIEITSNDHLSLLTQRFIGQPDETDGAPSPTVFGTFFHEAIELVDRRLWTTDFNAGFETGDLTEVSLWEAGTGDVAISTVQPFSGDYCAKCVVTAANDAAMVYKDLPDTGSGEIMFTTYVRMTDIPAPRTAANCRFFHFSNTGLAVFLVLTIDDNGYAYLWYDTGGAGNFWLKTDWNILNTEDQWVRLTFEWRQGLDRLKMWVDSDCVLDEWANLSFQTAQRASIGCYNGGGVAESWTVYVDNIELDDEAYPCGYYVPGYPFSSINKVWIDGRVTPKQKPFYAYQSPYVNYYREVYKNTWAGKRYPYDNYNTYESMGMIDIIPLETMPTGQVMMQVTKSGSTHPVDIIKDILTEVELDDYIDTDNFADAKAVYSTDVIGCYFDNLPAGDAISSICSGMLYEIFESAGKIKILPYTGTPPVAYVATLNNSNCYSFEENVNMHSIITGVLAKFSWFEKYSLNSYLAKDTDYVTLYGDHKQELDLSYGQDVQIDSATIAQAKADLLLKRLKGGVETVMAAGSLSLARIELGDGILIDNDLNSSGKVYKVVQTIINFTDRVVEITGVRYLGET